MSAKTCPRCGLVSPASATHCDCGFDLNSQGQDGIRHQSLRTARRTMAFGIALMTVGALITIGTWAASDGRLHIAFSGLTAAGAAVFWRGYSVRSRLTE